MAQEKSRRDEGRDEIKRLTQDDANVAGRPKQERDRKPPEIYRSPSFLRRGGSGLAVAKTEECLLLNPACRSVSRNEDASIILAAPFAEWSRSTKKLIEADSFSEEKLPETLRDIRGQPQHAAMHNASGYFGDAVSFGIFQSASSNALFAKAYSEGAVETLSADAELTYGAALSGSVDILSDILVIGSAVRYLHRKEAHAEVSLIEAAGKRIAGEKLLDKDNAVSNGQAFGADVSILLKGNVGYSPRLTILATDVGNTSFVPSSRAFFTKTENDAEVRSEGGGVTTVKQRVHLGLSALPDLGFSRALLTADYRDVTSAYEKSVIKRLHFGGDVFLLPDFVGIGAGLNQGYPSYGAFLDMKFIRAEAGVYTEESGEWAGRRPDKRVFVKLQLGF